MKKRKIIISIISAVALVCMGFYMCYKYSEYANKIAAEMEENPFLDKEYRAENIGLDCWINDDTYIESEYRRDTLSNNLYIDFNVVTDKGSIQKFTYPYSKLLKKPILELEELIMISDVTHDGKNDLLIKISDNVPYIHYDCYIWSEALQRLCYNADFKRIKNPEISEDGIITERDMTGKQLNEYFFNAASSTWEQLSK